MAREYLKAFIRTEENAKLKSGDMSMMRHASPEGGTDTVGYGRKLTKDENDSGKVDGKLISSFTIEDADRMLMVDINRSRASLNKRLQSNYDIELDSLSQRKQDMLTDYEYNLGDVIRKFPKFTRHVINNNEAGQIKEMVRNYTDSEGNSRPLSRNKRFFEAFMSTSAINLLGE
tara:strand:- start:7 stop:528 length:522 start_codon:yes stop_codon:yes gene_type:complete